MKTYAGKRGFIRTICKVVAFMLMLSCDKQDVSLPGPIPVFFSYSTSEQTLPAAIHLENKQIKLEVKHSANVTSLLTQFETTPGFDAYVNGVKQVSGSSTIDLSRPVVYELREKQGPAFSYWTVTAVPLGCNIIIDGSHDGGVWWSPQNSIADDPETFHKGDNFAGRLRSQGYDVTELGHGKALTLEMFFGSYIVVRVCGYESYSQEEVKVYETLIQRGTNLVFFTQHKQNDFEDEVGKLLGLEFRGMAIGQVTSFVPHELTANMVSLNYPAGSFLINADSNPNIEVLGSLRQQDFGDFNFNGIQDVRDPSAPPVMGVLTYPKSKIFFIGDTNTLEVQPQPFTDNLIHWMGNCVLD